mmetsp:Transcript_6879/g.17616  ORF Transcript_6879/g.17616 Transcript_6879/m.17616 type:complete len:383 (+) Transcript_6879:118-1266(+)
MEPERVQALRDTKALYDEGILDEAEYKAKKKELLAAPPAKALDECAFVAPKKTEQIFEPSTAFERRKGLGARRGWDARITRDPEDAAEISELVNKAYAADFGSGGFREGTQLITTKDVESDFNDPAVSWLVVEAISDEALLACVRTRFVGGRESGNRLAVFDCLASSKTSGDAGAAALNTAESAARAHGCCACNVEVPTPRVSDRTTLEAAGYAAAGPALKLPGSSTTYATLQKKLGSTPPPPPKRKLGVASSSQQFVAAPSPPVEAQLELCSALQGLGKLLDGDDTKTKKNPADAKLEGLVGDLIGALKTDAGKRDFERLAAAQNSEEDLAAKSPFPGFVPRPPGERRSFSGRGPASVEVNEPRAFVELLASDSRFTRGKE